MGNSEDGCSNRRMNTISNLAVEVTRRPPISKETPLASDAHISRRRERKNFVNTIYMIPSEYTQQEQPVRCCNCNRYRHTQAKCNNPARCGNCAAPHQFRDCPSTNPDKCASCLGAHRVTDSRCPHYRQEKERILRAQKQSRLRTGSPCL
jgi:hypothetical protein